MSAKMRKYEALKCNNKSKHAQKKNLTWITNSKYNLLERSLVIGISCISRLMHNHSLSSAINTKPVRFTIHHVKDDGHPPYMIQIKRWIMQRVAEKSKHFFALSIRQRMHPALLKKKWNIRQMDNSITLKIYLIFAVMMTLNNFVISCNQKMKCIK